MAVTLDLLNANSIDNINTNFQRVDTALQDALSRSGGVPNQMTADLDMNSNDILNVNNIDTESMTLNGDLITSLDGQIIYIPPEKIEIVVSTNYTVSVDDREKIITGNSASPITITLPAAALAAAEIPAGYWDVFIFNMGSGIVTVDGNGTETINGALTINLDQYDGVRLWTDGVTWRADGEFQGAVTFTNSFALGLAADGVTNDVPALIALEATANEVIRLKNATYFIGSNYTPTKTLKFSSDTRFLIADGVTLDWTTAQPDIDDEEQHFEFDGTGTGVVSGFNEVNVGWFAGDTHGLSTDANVELQRALDACVSGAIVRWPAGSFAQTGSTPLVVSKRQKIIGHGKWASYLHLTSTTTNGFQVTGERGAEFHGIQVRVTNTNTVVSGNGLEVLAADVRFDQFLTSGCFVGIKLVDGSGATRGTNFDALDSLSIGVWLQNTLEIFLSNYTIVAPYDRVTVSNVVGTFQAGEVVIGGTSGAVGELGEIVSPTLFRIKPNDINYTNTETITGQTSGATATVDSTTFMHQFGGMRLYNFVEGCTFAFADIIGGQYAMTIGADVNAVSERPAYCYFTNVLFDSADEGVFVDACSAIEFTSCWFSNRPGPGLQAIGSIDLKVTGGGARNCGSEGFRLGTALEFELNGVSVFGANGVVNASPGIKANSGADGQIIGGRSGGSGGFTNRLGGAAVGTYGVEIASGATVEVLGIDLSGNGTGPVSNSSSNSTLAHCPGYVNYKAGSVGVTTDVNGLGSVPHGLAVTPSWYDVRTQGDTVNFFQVISVDATNITVKLVNRTTNAAVQGTVTAFWEARAATAAS